jgi:uncharacterized membrane protein YkvA (DUF1232 family)
VRRLRAIFLFWRLLWRLWRRLPPRLSRPALLLAIAAAYVVSPVDLMPDVLPLLTWLDDAAVTAVLAVVAARAMRRPPTLARVRPPEG